MDAFMRQDVPAIKNALSAIYKLVRGLDAVAARVAALETSIAEIKGITTSIADTSRCHRLEGVLAKNATLLRGQALRWIRTHKWQTYAMTDDERTQFIDEFRETVSLARADESFNERREEHSIISRHLFSKGRKFLTNLRSTYAARATRFFAQHDRESLKRLRVGNLVAFLMSEKNGKAEECDPAHAYGLMCACFEFKFLPANDHTYKGKSPGAAFLNKMLSASDVYTQAAAAKQGEYDQQVAHMFSVDQPIAGVVDQSPDAAAEAVALPAGAPPLAAGARPAEVESDPILQSLNCDVDSRADEEAAAPPAEQEADEQKAPVEESDEGADDASTRDGAAGLRGAPPPASGSPARSALSRASAAGGAAPAAVPDVLASISKKRSGPSAASNARKRR